MPKHMPIGVFNDQSDYHHPTNTYTYNTNSPAKKRARSSSSLTPAEDNSLSDSIKLGTVRNWRDVQSTSDTKGQMKTLSMKKKDTNSTNNDSEEPLKLARNLENNTYIEKINKTRPQRSKHARGSHLDVWNRVAPKDVTAQCTNCNKIVGISRFAVHLDKCMGIGNVRKSSIHS